MANITAVQMTAEELQARNENALLLFAERQAANARSELAAWADEVSNNPEWAFAFIGKLHFAMAEVHIWQKVAARLHKGSSAQVAYDDLKRDFADRCRIAGNANAAEMVVIERLPKAMEIVADFIESS